MLSPVDVATHETVAFIKPRLRERASVLEVGCGAGEVAALLSRDFLAPRRRAPGGGLRLRSERCELATDLIEAADPLAVRR